jgi:hypothetical protein
MAYQRKIWPRPGGDRVEIITHVWAVDLVARSLCGGRLVREADAALCWALTGSVAPRGRVLDRLASGLGLPVRRAPAMVPDPRPATHERSARESRGAQPISSARTAPRARREAIEAELNVVRPGKDYPRWT